MELTLSHLGCAPLDSAPHLLHEHQAELLTPVSACVVVFCSCKALSHTPEHVTAPCARPHLLTDTLHGPHSFSRASPHNTLFISSLNPCPVCFCHLERSFYRPRASTPKPVGEANSWQLPSYWYTHRWVVFALFLHVYGENICKMLSSHKAKKNHG